MPRRLVRLRLEYDGTDFCGWQRQAKARTVQEALEQAITAVTGETAAVTSASRTDTGVHALGQVATFFTQTRIASSQLAAALTHALPPAVCVRRAATAPEGFHPQLAAVRKRYEYRFRSGYLRSPLLDRFWTHHRYPLDVPAMQAAAQHLIGRHDFRGFATRTGGFEAGFDFRRTIERLEFLRPAWDDPFGLGALTADGDSADAEARGYAGAWIMRIEGDGFLRNMVRAIIGSLFEIGRGKEPPTFLTDVLLSGDRREAGPTAPPEGLCLMHVFYPPDIGDL
ncbi:MAG: tRNA pseudouridine(38-40) synthase TruA [Planctomycetota bacterium]